MSVTWLQPAVELCILVAVMNHRIYVSKYYLLVNCQLIPLSCMDRTFYYCTTFENNKISLMCKQKHERLHFIQLNRKYLNFYYFLFSIFFAQSSRLYISHPKGIFPIFQSSAQPNIFTYGKHETRPHQCSFSNLFNYIGPLELLPIVCLLCEFLH